MRIHKSSRCQALPLCLLAGPINCRTATYVKYRYTRCRYQVGLNWVWLPTARYLRLYVPRAYIARLATYLQSYILVSYYLGGGEHYIRQAGTSRFQHQHRHIFEPPFHSPLIACISRLVYCLRSFRISW